MRSIFLNAEVDFVTLTGGKGGDANELGDVCECPGKSYLFFVRPLQDRGIGLTRETVRRPQSTALHVVSGAHS